MHLNRFTDYALRVLMHLAGAPGQRTTIHEVSRAHGISEQHLMKVVNRLAQLGYLQARRGRGGGIQAARPAGEISIGRVVRDLEPMVPVECSAEGYQGTCAYYPACSLKGVLHVAQGRFLEALDARTLADVLPRRPPRMLAATVARAPKAKRAGR